MMEQSSPSPSIPLQQPSQLQPQPQPLQPPELPPQEPQEPILVADKSIANLIGKHNINETDGDGLLPRSSSLSGMPDVSTNYTDNFINSRACI